MLKLDEINVELDLKFLKLGGKWKPNDEERQAAWEMYVELVTRITVAKLGPNEGLLREALTSAYSLFGTTRSILKVHGPTVAQPKAGELSFGYIAISVLNSDLRPLLAKWHPMLLDYEAQKPKDVSSIEHECKWEHGAQLRAELEEMRSTIVQYANILGEAAGVPSLIFDA